MSDRQSPDEDFEEVLRYLKETRGFDFTGYKRTSLMRRVHHRMSQVGIESHADYIDRLQVDPDEFNALFNTILINVTGFFRDREAWDCLRDDVVSAMLAERGPDEPIRVWSAGCASGEEAYTLAMVLAEVLGPERFRRQVKIYATDVDGEALAHARQAVYTERELEGVPPELVTTYFEPHQGRYAFRKDLRRTVIFGRNDLVQDAPISRIDLLVCRNTLMYFNQETQARILGRFHFALTPRGVLFLGKAEMLLAHGRLFDPIDLKRRLFRKANGSGGGVPNFVTHAFAQDRRIDVGGLDRLREHAFAGGPVAQAVINSEDVLVLANQQAEALFGLSGQDVGRPLRDLDLSYRPVELRGHVEQVRNERRPLRVKEVSWQRPGGELLWLEVDLNPLFGNPLSGQDSAIIGISIVFHDVTATRRLFDDLEFANQQLETAYEELQSTNEELETTNEELQSTVEELETTNEELQSTNEELETMNEELQSTNDELQTINDTLRDRTRELDQVNDFLESILTSLRAGVIVLDPGMRVIAWNRGAEELWGVRRDEAVGEHLLNLDIGLPLAELRPVVRQALGDASFLTEVKVGAINRKGRDVVVRVVCSSLRSNAGEPNGAILVMEQSG
ncbi:two-component system CheB/CheR fusion protein [Saccharothrix ecbatanensis]|uniref:protein-glutamate O-methyltransferase n=1 Tax=Saccharothrix ecbatanensis TaxID=1105145 RepID=A0A7W9LYF0_9PSEU|nr:CheR family methyltransferase [Saccharothrix ecbatanensis]MBB5800726.1 two-component system CheB/CheR fusion protein [Saccharothrix ecbatanensis]